MRLRRRPKPIPPAWLCAYVAHIDEELNAIDRKLEQIMSDQTHIDAETANIANDVAKQATALDAIKTEIANLQAAPPGTPLDFTALDAAVASLDTATAAEQAAVPPAPPAPPA